MSQWAFCPGCAVPVAVPVDPSGHISVTSTMNITSIPTQLSHCGSGGEYLSAYCENGLLLSGTGLVSYRPTSSPPRVHSRQGLRHDPEEDVVPRSEHSLTGCSAPEIDGESRALS